MYAATECNISEDLHLNQYCCEGLEYHFVGILSVESSKLVGVSTSPEIHISPPSPSHYLDRKELWF